MHFSVRLRVCLYVCVVRGWVAAWMFEFVLEMSLTSVLTLPFSLTPPAFSYVSPVMCHAVDCRRVCMRGCVFGHQESVLRWWPTTSSSACLPHRVTTMCFLSDAPSHRDHVTDIHHIMTPGPHDIRWVHLDFSFYRLTFKVSSALATKDEKTGFLLRRKTGFLR